MFPSLILYLYLYALIYTPSPTKTPTSCPRAPDVYCRFSKCSILRWCGNAFLRGLGHWHDGVRRVWWPGRLVVAPSVHPQSGEGQRANPVTQQLHLGHFGRRVLLATRITCLAKNGKYFLYIRSIKKQQFLERKSVALAYILQLFRNCLPLAFL